MAGKVEYFIPKTFTTWTIETENEVTDFEALELVKEHEGVKRVPPSWRVTFQKNGKMIEVNRRAAPRHKAEAKVEGK